MNFEKPEAVRKAQIARDKEKLSRMGKKGAQVSDEVRSVKKILAEETATQKEYDMEYLRILHEEGEEAALAYKAELEDLKEAS